MKQVHTRLNGYFHLSELITISGDQQDFLKSLVNQGNAGDMPWDDRPITLGHRVFRDIRASRKII